MRLLDPTWIRDTSDYSFGDESGLSIGGYIHPANMQNEQFMNRYRECVQEGRPFMILFIDNIRLYQRDCIRYTAVEQINPTWKNIKDEKVRRFHNEDLLRMCGQLTDMAFIIFTGFEDTPIDEGIWKALPENVLGVYACNCMEWRDIVHPIPFGLQRILAPNDYRQQAILELLQQPSIEPGKLMYINFNPGNHPTRQPLFDKFSSCPWVTAHTPGLGLVYDNAARNYYGNIRNHKFMLCPSGNAEGCECHRDWEALYMRRVPIVKDTPYLREIFKDIPVLFIDDLINITEQLLIDNDYLYQQMQEFDLNKLDIEVLYNNCIKEATLKLVTV